MTKRSNNIKFGIILICMVSYQLVHAQCSELDIQNLKKIAIVFGEKDYKYGGSLNNPINDAQDISDSLKKVGFDVFTYQNTDLKTMNSAIDEWCNKLNKYDVSLFYYSGHGAEVNGENFLFPIDANPKGPSDLLYSGYSANKLLDRMDNSTSRYNIMILDACRNNPFTRNWARDFGKGGLSAMSGRGAFIGYAASPGTTASDGSGRNGTYTEAILNNITIPNLTIDQIFTKVNYYVRSKSAGSQIPFKNSSLSTDFCFSVHRGNRSNASVKANSFVQPASGILLTSNEDYIITADAIRGGLMIKDAKTLNNLNVLLSQNEKPNKITSRFGSSVYVIDSAVRALFVIDAQKRIIKAKIQLPGLPTSIAVSNDERKAYVSVTDGNNSGSISVLNLINFKIIKTLTLANCPSALVISPDHKFLFISPKFRGGEESLVIVEIKTDKIIKTIPNAGSGNAIGITPDNKKLYISNTKSQSGGQLAECINVIDIVSSKNLKSIDFKANSFSFTPDNKHVFALGETEIAIIRTIDNEISNRLPFATAPSGLSIDNGGNGFVWLPRENRIFVFKIGENLESKLGYDLESNLNKFKEELKKRGTNTVYEEIRGIFAKVNEELRTTIDKLRTELGSTFSSAEPRLRIRYVGDLIGFNYNGDGIGYNYKNLVYVEKYGIYNVYDRGKTIWPTYNLTIDGDKLMVTIKQEQNSSEQEIFRSPLNSIDWNELRKFVRSYFLKRIDRLK